MSKESPPPIAFFKRHIVPALFIFLIPAFSAWFFVRAESWLDRQIIEAVNVDLERNKVSAGEKTRIQEFFARTPGSQFMASRDPKLASLQESFRPTEFRYTTFRWMKRTAWVCLGTIFVTLIVVGVSVAFSFRSHAAQYRALRVGWPILRFSAAIQVLGQGVLAVALSYWVTAIWLQSYVPKLIMLIAIMAGCAVFALWKAIFAPVDQRLEIAGALANETEAPRLWERVRELAARLSTAPPDQIVIGIEPSFFVTEHPVIVGTERFYGRTLYLSLPLLKVLSASEADAILGHELAHFSGDDTMWSMRIAPLKVKFATYLQILAQGLSLIVAHFMYAFWKLYELSLNRLSRAREFRADRIGADLTTPEDAKRALIKVTSYCDFRAKTECSILKQNRVDHELDLARQLEAGFPNSLAAFTSASSSVAERVPHPFDSHPTLSSRLEQLGFDANAALQDDAIHPNPAHSWYDDVTTARELEARLWSEQQQAMQTFHQEDLLWRLLPTTEEDAAILRQHFPRITFQDKRGGMTHFDVDRIQLPGDPPLFFRDILHAELNNSWLGKRLTLNHGRFGPSNRTKTVIVLKHYVENPHDFLTSFTKYFSRHKMAEARATGNSC